MRNIKLTIEYDGTGYAGWQVQPGGVKTIQGTLVHCLGTLIGEGANVQGASRTDAGVHALGQVAAFRTESKMPLLGVQKGLNSLLPPDIVIKRVEEVPHDFDPRRDATSKTYIYRILNRPWRTALCRHFSWFIYHGLDPEPMNVAAGFLVGERDFTSFMAAGSDAVHAVREITSIQVGRKGDFVEIKVEGTAFLRHMVRIMVGTLVSVGMGRMDPGAIVDILEAKDRTRAGITAPPQGLFLKEVNY